MNHKEWLEWRMEGVCASDAPVIMGVSPWKTYQQLLMEKVTGIDNILENDNMKYGKETEEEARLCFEAMTGHIVFPDIKIVHPEFSWIRATLDGLDMDRKIMVEIKNANKKDHFDAFNKMIPDKYFPQCQHQMLTAELDTMSYFSYRKKLAKKGMGIIVEVQRNDRYIEIMLEKHKIFWDQVLELRHKLKEAI
jgi:putative phage-type endonuclease